MNKTQTVVYDLLLKNKIFCKCPSCQKYLVLFEIYNAHCAECGNINKDEILLIDLFSQKSDI
jgi:uncharacterized Zn finger protein